MTVHNRQPRTRPDARVLAAIRLAATEAQLQEVEAFIATVTGASPKTRRRWARALELRRRRLTPSEASP